MFTIIGFFFFFFSAKDRSIPKWPMNAVSIREAMGSAAAASAAGNAIPSISLDRASSLKTSLHSHMQNQVLV